MSGKGEKTPASVETSAAGVVSAFAGGPLLFPEDQIIQISAVFLAFHTVTSLAPFPILCAGVGTDDSEKKEINP